MIDHTTALYCIVDDLLKAVGHKDDCRRGIYFPSVLPGSFCRIPHQTISVAGVDFTASL